MARYITAFDPVIRRRVPFTIDENGIATSTVTGHQFRYTGFRYRR